jgi:Nucleotide-sugar transporter.
MSRNAQLAWYSSLSAIFGFISKSKPGAISFFHGYDHLVWSFALLQAIGGFLVAWCVSLTSTVTKNYAQAVGFLLASTVPFLLQHGFQFQVTFFLTFASDYSILIFVHIASWRRHSCRRRDMRVYPADISIPKISKFIHRSTNNGMRIQLFESKFNRMISKGCLVLG